MFSIREVGEQTTTLLQPRGPRSATWPYNVKSFECPGPMLGSNRRDNNVESRLKYSLGWPVLKDMRCRMPFSRSLQHSDRLRHIESTVLSDEFVCLLFVRLCSATSLSGKWVVEGKKRVRSGRNIEYGGIF